MTDQELRTIASEVLLKLEGDERISDIIHEAIVDVLYANDIDGYDDEHFDSLMDLTSNICLYSNL